MGTVQKGFKSPVYRTNIMIGVNFAEVRELDQWMRRRMRLYYWKQWGRPKTRRRRLIALGIDRDEVKRASRSRKGHWRMSCN